MSDPISNSITLRGLEVFEELARTGSMQDTARKLGMSAPAASQQLKNLELALGQDLVDHNRRPLEPTRAGLAYLGHVRAALVQLRQGAAELSLIDLRSLRRLRIGVIDDFDVEVTPRLTQALASVLTPCDLTIITAASLRIVEDVAERGLDLGIAARPFDLPAGIMETPLLRDPFMLAVPRGYLPAPPDSIEALNGLQFLRYERSQLLGRQIAAHLARLKLAPQGRIELDSNQAIFGLIANGAGWTICTPLSFLRARRFHGQVDLYPLPFAGFSRTILLFHPADWMAEIAAIIADTLREILRAQVVEPGRAALPWIGSGLAILPG